MRIITLLIVLFISTHCYAETITLQEVEEFFANTQELYEPVDEEFNKELAQMRKDNPAIASRLTPMEAYYYPAVDIAKLWQRLGVTTRLQYVDSGEYIEEAKGYIFGYPSSHQEEHMLKYPATKLYEFNNIKVLRISGASIYGDYQYLLFRKEGDRWIYSDHIDIEDDKYGEPEITFLSDSLLIIKTLGSHGTGIISYWNLFYHLTKDEAKRLFSMRSEGERHGWGMLFDFEFRSTFNLYGNRLIGDYVIDVEINTNNYEPTIKPLHPVSPLFTAKRTIVLDWDGEKFDVNKAESDVSLEDIDNFFGGCKEYYSLFKNEFDQFEHGNNVQQEWYEKFLKEAEEILNES